MKIIRGISLFTVFAFLFVMFASCGDGEWVIKSKNFKLQKEHLILEGISIHGAISSENMQMNAQMSGDGELKGDSKSKDGRTFDEILEERLKQSGVHQLGIQEACKEKKISLDEQKNSAIDKQTEEYWDKSGKIAGEVYELSKPIIRDFFSYRELSLLLFDKIYGKDGEKEVTKESLEETIAEKSLGLSFFSISILEEPKGELNQEDAQSEAAPKELSKEKVEKIEKAVAESVDALNSGKDIKEAFSIANAKLDEKGDERSIVEKEVIPIKDVPPDLDKVKGLGERQAMYMKLNGRFFVFLRNPKGELEENIKKKLESDESFKEYLSAEKQEEFENFVKEKAGDVEYNQEIIKSINFSKINDMNKKSREKSKEIQESENKGEGGGIPETPETPDEPKDSEEKEKLEGEGGKQEEKKSD
ncbi:MAG: hypothetical protein LBI55_02295 [Oscillospiraceae bacterium]|jgi:hypothetical protein|nr:hypothetical protein [Oscillospiraceae bacterium]